MKTCCYDTLSIDAVEEIEEKLGNKNLVYILAVDTEGNLTPLKNEIVREVKMEFPIPTKFIHRIDSAAFGRFEGSCVYYVKIGGDKVPRYFKWPDNMPCPPGTSKA